MFPILKNSFARIDFLNLFVALMISILGLSIIYSFSGDNGAFYKQLVSLSIAIMAYFIANSLDVYFLKNSRFIFFLYFFAVGLLLLLFATGAVFSGAQSWFSLGFFAFQPTDLAKLVLVILLAKFFYKRHVEISRFRHLLVSGFYAGVIFILLAAQPDLGSAMIIFFIWFGFILVAGVPKKHIIFLFGLGVIAFTFLYFFIFADYQKDRVLTFLNPGSDLLDSGYNINQANIALGSGEIYGKGVLFGTQSRLDFLPEANTDFIYSSFGEEWGFIGICILMLLFGILFYRLIRMGMNGRTNFETLLIVGVAIYFFSHFFIHIGINLGFMPVTGTTLPFMSFGGSHILIEYFALGLAGAVGKTNRDFHRDDLEYTDILG